MLTWNEYRRPKQQATATREISFVEIIQQLPVEWVLPVPETCDGIYRYDSTCLIREIWTTTTNGKNVNVATATK